ncbi:N-acetyltransferase [Actinoplanes italicus]|uniref:Acetyltransferase (GNAT) family protein n=1 Tax=Actinoplanes italicus TaxID=113567 RepID=A0A2T0JWZ0_9ACTN|nr:GNAT family N-acetyltransferase [Actinoplanes italicus]PRX11990.1 acetyltransferase (GNAT) family protein [Actinoplanes italicus]GIE30941.1 N-acetyltransferase [Actinoplanes italicus]
MEIRRLATFDGPEAAAWYDAWRSGATADRYAALVTSRDSQLKSLAANATNPNRHREAWGAWNGDSCVGGMLVEWALQENLHRAEIDIAVPPAHRRRGVGAALWTAGLNRARTTGRDTVIAEVHVPRGRELAGWPGGRFALARGFGSALAEERMVLDLPVAEHVLATHDLAKPGYRAETWHGPMPPGSLAALADLTSEMATDVPTGELDVEAARWDAERLGTNQERLTTIGYALVTTVITTDSGEPAGYTQLLVDADGIHVHQDDTYVRKAHRGNRLGAFAKARNVRELVSRHTRTQHIHTWTASTNDAMRTINESFGFRPVEVTHNMESSGH